MDIEKLSELSGGSDPSFRQSEPRTPLKPRSESRPRLYLTELEVEAMVHAVSGRNARRDAAMILIAYRHGLRANEITKLQWASIVLSGKRTTITINRSKGGVSTVHPLRGPEIRALRAWQGIQNGRSPYVFTSLRGGPLSLRAVHLIVQEAGAAAVIPFAVHPHMLRHACGFKLANDGQDTRAIQDYLGHRSINSTVRYTALAPNRFEGFWDD